MAFAGLPIHGGGACHYRIEPIGLLPTVVRCHVRLWYEMTRALKALAERPA
jgi:hypothetical protein